MKAHDIRELMPQELEEKIADKAEELANLKFQLALHQLDDSAKVRLARRELARLKTIFHEHKTGIRALKTQPGTAGQENQ